MPFGDRYVKSKAGSAFVQDLINKVEHNPRYRMGPNGQLQRKGPLGHHWFNAGEIPGCVNRALYEAVGEPIFTRYLTNKCTIDTTTDIAEQLSLIKDVIYLVMASLRDRYQGDSMRSIEQRRNLDNLSDGEIEDLAYRIIYGAEILANISIDTSLRALCIKHTTSDSTAASPYIHSTRSGILSSLSNLYFHPLSFAMAEIWTAVLQAAAPETRSQEFGSYVCVMQKNLNAADLETKIATFNSQYGAADAAQILGSPLRRPKMDWLNKVRVFPYVSEIGQMISYAMPVRDDTTLEDLEMDGVIANMRVCQFLGHGPIWDAMPLFRDSAATATPGWVVTGVPSAGKLSVQKLTNVDDTSLTEAPDTSSSYDFLMNVAGIRAVTRNGTFSRYSAYVSNISSWGPASTAGWNNNLARWMVSQFYDPDVFCYSSFAMMPDNLMGFMYQDRSIVTGNRLPMNDPSTAVTIPLLSLVDFGSQKTIVNGLKLDILRLVQKAIQRGVKGKSSPLIARPVNGKPLTDKPRNEIETVYKNIINSIVSGSKDVALDYVRSLATDKALGKAFNFDMITPESPQLL